ncbi:DUF4097 family beta strand repeat-containing protein [Brevibacillus agri]|uniref:DUF4097 family beta strand repeat-containing protein n=1 Tax=Brevibacillus agri TaxID=51101 RepID=UPI0024BF8D0F|nr:DUF4097 family beta strand repeat-containing protein [Brevibacillus agri]MED4569020.1 DUF4097 family beta strand repeat-containing protein [Brevibacillus agri]WHX30589.1 DUF4097 family beta strand repeat-containing protein [Brevibacillus agri]
MKSWIGAGFLALAIGLAGCSNGSLQTVEEKRHLELPIAAIETLEIATASGDLIVKGDDKATSIQVDATINRSPNINPEDIEITLAEDGAVAQLTSESRAQFGVAYMKLKLEVTVPSGLKVAITDGSGDIDVSKLAGPLTIADDSGDIRLKDVTGEVEINDQSGDIKISKATALKLIEDDSGDILLEDTVGDVEIRDQSGDMNIVRHKGNLSISDESGDIDIYTVDGNVEIVEDGSGKRSVKNVSGSYTEN